jgi:hypothetical protein
LVEDNNKKVRKKENIINKQRSSSSSKQSGENISDNSHGSESNFPLMLLLLVIYLEDNCRRAGLKEQRMYSRRDLCAISSEPRGMGNDSALANERTRKRKWQWELFRRRMDNGAIVLLPDDDTRDHLVRLSLSSVIRGCMQSRVH